eukprot:8991340-Pyramimonas_sp.AAC.2
MKTVLVVLFVIAAVISILIACIATLYYCAGDALRRFTSRLRKNKSKQREQASDVSPPPFRFAEKAEVATDPNGWIHNSNMQFMSISRGDELRAQIPTALLQTFHEAQRADSNMQHGLPELESQPVRPGTHEPQTLREEDLFIVSLDALVDVKGTPASETPSEHGTAPADGLGKRNQGSHDDLTSILENMSWSDGTPVQVHLLCPRLGYPRRVSHCPRWFTRDFHKKGHVSLHMHQNPAARSAALRPERFV